MSKRHIKKDEWFLIFEKQKKSGFSAKVYCQQNDLNLSAFRVAKSRYKNYDPKENPHFIELQKVSPSPKSINAPQCIIETPNGVKISLNSIDKDFLLQVLSGRVI